MGFYFYGVLSTLQFLLKDLLTILPLFGLRSEASVGTVDIFGVRKVSIRFGDLRDTD